MIVQYAIFSKSPNPRNIDKSVSDIRIRFLFESSFWISLSCCKFTILPDIQPANRIVIISGICIFVQHFDFKLVSDIAIKSGETLHIEKKVSILCLFLTKLRTLQWK